MHERSHKKYLLIKTAVYLILSVITFIFRYELVERLNYFIGALMIIYGAEEFLFEMMFYGKDFWKREKLFLGFVELIFGIFLVCAPIDIESTCVVWASWAIIRESYEIRELFVTVKRKVLSVVSGIESVLVIVLSFILILEAGARHAIIHTYLLLAELVLTPLIPLFDEFFTENGTTKTDERQK